MDQGKYIDFDEENEERNVVWNFVEQKNGGFKFEQYHLNHATLGDSDSVYLKLSDIFDSDAKVDDVVDMADTITRYVNDSYHNFAMHAFNCPADRTNELLSNREIVADAIYVSTKKRYAAHVVDDEGKRVDKLKIKGMEIIKSDTPAYVKVMLMDMVRAILDDKSRQDLQDMIKEFKIEYQKHPLRDIARPMSVKGLKKYNDMLETTGSTKGFPYNVRAAMFYNSLCGTSDKKIVPGDKIGIIYIKDPRSKYIAFPIDINEFPSFMNGLVVDYETQWEKAYKKITSYMASMGWDLESRKKELRKNLFGF